MVELSVSKTPAGSNHSSPTLGRVENPEPPETNLGGAETFRTSPPPGHKPFGADTFRPNPGPGEPRAGGADIILVQEWDIQPWAEMVTLSVIGWRNPIPVLKAPHSRILWKIGSRIANISSARKHAIVKIFSQGS